MYFALHNIEKHTMTERPRAVFCAGAVLYSISPLLIDICVLFSVV